MNPGGFVRWERPANVFADMWNLKHNKGRKGKEEKFGRLDKEDWKEESGTETESTIFLWTHENTQVNPTIMPTHKNGVLIRIRYILCLYNFIKMDSTIMYN